MEVFPIIIITVDISKDDQSDPQRQLAASLILHRSQFESVNHSSEVFLLGDFNSPAMGRGSAGYGIITGARPPVKISQEFKEKYPVSGHTFTMVDVLGRVPRHRISGNHGLQSLSIDMYLSSDHHQLPIPDSLPFMTPPTFLG